MRPDTTEARPLSMHVQREKAVSVSQTFRFLHPAARICRFFSCGGLKKVRKRQPETKQACVLAQSRQQ
jgi:hypothetical protein